MGKIGQFSFTTASHNVLPQGVCSSSGVENQSLATQQWSSKPLVLPFQFRREEDAEKAVMDLNNRWFNGQPIHAELSPVTDFREACCRQYEMG